ncbi:MAG: endonuclease MutS2, partial [Terriglobales bacterium]
MAPASDLATAAGVTLPDGAATLELVGGYLQTAMGRAELSRLRFHRDRAELEHLHRRCAQAQVWLGRGGFGFGGLQDPSDLLDRARLAGAVLDAPELLQIASFLEAIAGLAAALLGQERELWPELAALAAGIPEVRELLQALRRALLPTGEVNDDASPELGRLRRRRTSQRQAIEAALAEQMRRLSGEGVLQDELVTLRNERFVLPVRAEQRRRAAGVVHGASSSGQTLFVEPLETVELNNENIRLRDMEHAEVLRILAALTAK